VHFLCDIFYFKSWEVRQLEQNRKTILFSVCNDRKRKTGLGGFHEKILFKSYEEYEDCFFSFPSLPTSNQIFAEI